MEMVADLDLLHLPIEEPRLAGDPQPYFDAARSRHPWLAKSTFGYVVTEYDAMKELLTTEGLEPPGRSMTRVMGGEGTRWGRFNDEMLVARQGETHRRLRNIVAPAFTPRKAKQHRQTMRRVISELLDQWAPKRSFNFAEFAAYFPITVMFSLIGAPAEAVQRIRSSLEIQGMSFNLDRSLLPALLEAFDVLWEFIDRLVKDRETGHRTSDQHDLLDDLLKAKQEGGLTDLELRDMVYILFAAGYDTSKNMLTMIANLLLDRPDDWRRCAEDKSYCGKVVEETFRYASVVNTSRMTANDFVYRDVMFPPETLLLLPLSMAGRDPKSFLDPLAFRPERSHPNRHIAFGRGPHLCLGIFIAQAQIEEGLHIITQRLANPKRAGDIAWRPFHGVWGLETLPIVFEPANAITDSREAL